MFKEIKSFIDNFFVEYPGNYREKFIQKRDYKNYYNMKFLLIFFLIMAVFMLFIQYFINGFSLVFKLNLAFFPILIIFTYLYYKNKPGKIVDYDQKHNLLFYVTLFFLLLWGTIGAGILPGDNLSLFVYIALVFFLSVLFYLKWKLFLLINGASFGLILILTYVFGDNSISYITLLAILTSVYLLAWVVNRINYQSFLEDFVSRQKLEIKYDKLLRHRQHLEDVLDEKTEEIYELTDKIKHTRSRLKLALTEAETGFWEWNIEDNKVIYNDQWAKMLGFHVNKLNGRIETWKELVHTGDQKKINDIIEKCKKGEIDSFEFEHRLKTSSGSWKWVYTRGRLIAEDEERGPLKVIGVHKDITQFKKIKKALQKSEEKFNKFLEVIPVPLMFYRDDKWTYVNRAAEKLLGYSRKELLDRNFWGFVHPDFKDKIRQNREGSQGDFYKLKILDKEENEKWVQFSARRLKLAGKEVIMIVAIEIYKDI